MSGAWVWIALGSLLIGLHDVLFSVGLLEGVRYSELSSVRIEFWMFACLGLWGFISLGLGFAQQITAEFA